jgi:hypothetical protein
MASGGLVLGLHRDGNVSPLQQFRGGNIAIGLMYAEVLRHCIHHVWIQLCRLIAPEHELCPQALTPCAVRRGKNALYFSYPLTGRLVHMPAHDENDTTDIPHQGPDF